MVSEFEDVFLIVINVLNPSDHLVLSPPQWKENPSLSESQVQSLALSRQSSQELEIKRREAIYNDVLAKQQMVSISPVSHAGR